MPENELLESLILAYPCPIKWETMSGDERKRFCEKCSMHVFNISDLSKEEAESFLKESLSSESVCVKFFLRRDGTIKTNNCPKIFRSIYSRILWFGAGFSYVSMLLVASKSALLETIELLKKLESKVFPAALLKEQLQAALRIEEFKNAGNEKAIREIEKITSESAQRNELVRSDVIFLTTEKNTKRLSAVKYLDSYKIIEYLKVPTKSQLPTRYVETREDFLTLDEDSPISAYPAMDSKFRYLVCITNPEYDGDAVKHSGKDFILIKSPTDNELNLLKETIKNASDRKILQCQ